jgi:hypothetical protein
MFTVCVCVFLCVCAGWAKVICHLLEAGSLRAPQPHSQQSLPGNLMARELAMREDHLQAEGGSKGPSVLPSHPVTFSLDVAEMCLLIIDHGVALFAWTSAFIPLLLAPNWHWHRPPLFPP